MLEISNIVSIPDNEIEIKAIRAQGTGGQNVNKVSSAIHLRFDINASSLPDIYKQCLLKSRDKRISKNAVIIIKAQQFRTQKKNLDEALERLKDIIKNTMVVRKIRRATKPSRGSQRRRLDNKSQRGKIKALRSRVLD